MKLTTVSELICILACFIGSVQAATPKPAKMNCEEFIALDDVVKPKVVYWMQGLNDKGKPETAYFDVEETDRLVPILVEECGKTPKQSLWSRFKEKAKKIL